jgi:hypothetical protein
MKQKQYKNFKYDLTWNTSMNMTVWIAHGIVNGKFLLVHSAVSEETCIAKMEEKIESEVIAHQI